MQEDERRQAGGERGDEAERVVDRRADVAVGGREQRVDPEHALQSVELALCHPRRESTPSAAAVRRAPAARRAVRLRLVRQAPDAARAVRVGQVDPHDVDRAVALDGRRRSMRRAFLRSSPRDALARARRVS